MSTVHHIFTVAAVIRTGDSYILLLALYFRQKLVAWCFFRWERSEVWVNIKAGVQNLESIDRGPSIVARSYCARMDENVL